MFCESLIEEYEEELTSMLMGEVDDTKPNMTQRVCKEQLNLCVPPPPPPKPKRKKKEKPKTRKQILEEARKVFKSMDADANGFITRKEMEERLQTMASSGQLEEGKDVQTELDRFFEQIDKNKDDRVDFYEYKFMWVEPKRKGGDGAAARPIERGSLEYYVGPTLAAVMAAVLEPILETMPEAVQTAGPGVLLGGLGVTTLAVCVGGRAVRG